MPIPNPKGNDREFQIGEVVETVHGERVTVLDTVAVPMKAGGKFTGTFEKRILAVSGDQKDKEGNPIKTWFPYELIK